jgi:hypothetical protein
MKFSKLPNMSMLCTHERLFGYSNLFVQNPDGQIWKIFHAETMRVIWYSRCRMLYDKEDMPLEQLKGIIRHRVQRSFSIYELLCLQKNIKNSTSIANWKLAFPGSLIKRGRLSLLIP